MILDAPPKGWKRPSIPLGVQVKVLKAKLAKVLGVDKIEIDHRPPLYLRKFDTDKNDTIPPANDPFFMEALGSAEHKVRTGGTKATSAGSDAHVRAKIKRLTLAPLVKALWPSRKIPSRKFAKRK